MLVTQERPLSPSDFTRSDVPVPVVAFGDWHGDTTFARMALLAADSLVVPGAPFVHVGDFNLVEHPAVLEDAEQVTADDDVLLISELVRATSFMGAIDTTLRKMNRVLYVVLGDHDSYYDVGRRSGFSGFFTGCPEDRTWAPRLYGHQPPKSRDDQGFIVSKHYTNIRVIPRTHAWSWGGRVFASLGGAASLHYELHPCEMPTIAQAQTLSGVDADVLFTHEAPTHVIHALGLNEGDARLVCSSAAVDEAIRLTSPELVVCGHLHTPFTAATGKWTTQVLGHNDGYNLRFNRTVI